VERLAYWRGANFVVDGGGRPERGNEVPAFKAERLTVVKSWPTGVTQPDQFGSQVLPSHRVPSASVNSPHTHDRTRTRTTAHAAGTHQWFVLTREFVEYVLTSAFARNVLVAMAADKAQIPDESYFQVVLMNSPFNTTVSQRVLFQTGRVVCVCVCVCVCVSCRVSRTSLLTGKACPRQPATAPAASPAVKPICRYLRWHSKCLYSVHIDPPLASSVCCVVCVVCVVCC
jgi:hypothetical protein